ncbi:MAG: hypothetical protein EOO21_04300 [Comamonadaceae bacterium]|nr:MAG: hypothetical protein EOO21_04300 [Comamonadaceae bacterium]
MTLSPYFHNLRTAYRAELDDLTSDSEGKDVLQKRLAQKRKEIGFLVQMLELSPEMVAVAFHRAFKFPQPRAIEPLVGLEAAELPEWGTLAQSVTLEPWAVGMAEAVLKEPGGSRFLVAAATLEYLQTHARPGPADAGAPGDDDADDDQDDDDQAEDDETPLSADDARDPQTNRSREDASSDWLSDQGFDRKE